MPSSVQIVWKNHKMGEATITMSKITDSKNEIMRMATKGTLNE
jgi:hypothetical protein